MVVITGDRDGGTAVDYTVNAALGFPWLTGPEGHDGPVNHVLPAWDGMTGFLAALAILAAERHRRLHGEGQLVQLSLAVQAPGTLGRENRERREASRSEEHTSELPSALKL